MDLLRALQDDTELIDFLIDAFLKSVQSLIDREADLECNDNHFFYQCITYCESRAEIIDYVIKRGANIEAKGYAFA